MILGFLLTALYWPGIAGAATTPKWGLLAVALPVCLLWGKGKFTLAHMFGVAFVVWASVSLLWTPNQLDGANELIKLVILAQAFVYGSRLKDLRPVLIGMGVGLVPSSVAVLVQIYYPDVVMSATEHSGLFVNSGSLAEITALVLIGLVGVASRLREFILIICLLPCIILPMSRGAWLALAAAFTVWLWGRSKLSALALVTLTGGLIAYSLHAGFHVGSVTQRLGIWSDAIAGMTWLGHGLGSFWTDYAPLSNTLDIFIERPEHLHNDWLEIVFELGPVGAVCISVLVISIWCSGRDVISRAVLAGFAAEALVGFPLHVPCTGFVAALCLGHLARDGHDLRYLFHAGRIRLQARLIRHKHRAEGRRKQAERGILPAGSPV